MNTNNIGGGEVLKYVGQDYKYKHEYLYMDEAFMNNLATMSTVRIAVILLLVVLAIIITLKILEIRNPLRGRAMVNELDYLDKIRKRDENIIKANKTIGIITKIVEMSPFALSKSYIDYWKYNLERANVRIPGGFRVMKPQEFNAIVKACEAASLLLSLLLCAFVSIPLGAMLAIATVFIGETMPMQTVRQSVKAKDAEIVENFADFYLMIHYVLLASAGTPIAGIMKSFDKTTDSEEMHRFIDVCLHNIDTFGEYEATRHITKQYREIPQVGKLMRLIRQANEGGDVRAELVGFRDELLSAKKYVIRRRMEKLVAQAKASFNILTPILIQAIISAMAIYVEDLSLAGSFM